MKILKKITALLILISIISSCNNNNCIDGEGPIITKILELDNFNKVDILTSSNITISQGDTQEIKIMGHSNIIDQLNASVTNSNLYINLEEGCYSDIQLDIEITIPILESINTNGSSNVIINDFENQNSLEISTNGSGSILLNKFEGITNLNVYINGSSSVEGNKDIISLENSNVNITGSGRYYGYNISSKNITASVSGSGKAELTVTDNLDINITGSGKIYYKGNPEISQSITGSGKLINDN